MKRKQSVCPIGYATIVALLTCLPLNAQDNKTKLAPGPWSECEVGSWIILREETKSGGKEKNVKEKHERVAWKGLKDVYVAVFPEVDGKFGKEDHVRGYGGGALPDPADAKSVRQEVLMIGGKRLPCTRTEYLIQIRDRGFKATLILWRCAEVTIPSRKMSTGGGDPALPVDVMRAEYTYKTDAGTGKYTDEVIALTEDLKVGKRTVKCVVERLRFEEQGKDFKGQGEGKRWLSREVPGHEVKVTAEGTMNGMPLRMERVVLDFKMVKR